MTIIFSLHSLGALLAKLVQDVGNVIRNRRQRSKFQRCLVGVRHDDNANGTLSHVRCPSRGRIDVQPSGVLIIRVRFSFQVEVGPFHDEWVADSNGDRERF